MSAATTEAQSSGRRTGLLWALAAAGAAAFVSGVLGSDPRATWGIYLVNLLFWSSFAITGPALAGMMQMTEARWSPSVKRLALTTAGFLPVSLVGFVILFFGRATLYPWVTHPLEKKVAWLNVPFMSLRIALGSLALYWIAMTFAKAVFAQDAPGAETPEAHARRNRLATILLMLYVVVLSLWGFDLLMSLDPTWYSGLLGGYYVVTSLYTGFGLVTFLTIRANARGVTEVSPSVIQDMAKLTFAMCVMWMYFFFSQYIVIWYGNVPIETRFFLNRFFNPPWGQIAWAIFIVGWLIPFAYLLKRLTGRPPTRHKVFTVILFMGWTAIFVERILIVFPALDKNIGFPLGIRELFITAGFLALFILSRRRFLAKYQPVLRQPK
jgi:Ni/Fe-hydrogenase subunit HybB-like protein